MRIAIMLTLITLFFVISPLIILYTIGYRYSFSTGLVTQTGAISIDVEPEDTHVFVQNVAFDQKMPLRLRNIKPGFYDIRLEHEGYKTWQKSLLVENNKTAYIRDVTLIKDTQPTELFVGITVVEAHATAATDSILAILKNTDAYELVLLYPDTSEQETLQTFATKPEVHVSPFTNTAITISKTPRFTQFKLFDTRRPNRSLLYQIPLNSTFSYQWSKQHNEVYLNIDGTIERLNVEGDSRQIATTSSSQWFVEYPDTIWKLQDRTFSLQKDSSIAYSVTDTIDHIIDVTKERIILKSQNDILVIHRNRPPEQAISRLPAHSWNYNTQQDAWWFWSDFELWSINNAGDIALIERSDNKIERVLPFDLNGVKLLVHTQGALAFNPSIFPKQSVFEADAPNWASTNAKERTLHYSVPAKDDSITLYRLDY